MFNYLNLDKSTKFATHSYKSRSQQDSLRKKCATKYYLLVQLCLAAVGPGGSHPPGSVDGLVRRRGEHQQLVPLVRQQLGVDVHGNVVVERKATGPLNQLVHDRVADLAELLLKVRSVLVQEFANILKKHNNVRCRFFKIEIVFM